MEAHVSKPLPPAILSHDGKKILDTDTMVPMIQAVMEEIGKPQFTDPVYLSIHTPLMITRDVVLSDAKALRETLYEQASQSVLGSDNPLIQYSTLWQHGQTAAVASAAISSTLVKDYCDLFYQAGFKVHSMDLLPLSVLRAMAASGVLDALLRKLDAQAVWGCFGFAGSQVWCTLWQGTNLLQIASFATPATPKEMEERLIEYLTLIGVDKPAVWFAWQEHGFTSPINPLSLKLKAPVLTAVLGPFYAKSGQFLSMAALGSALKSEITFPLGWDFLADPTTEPLKADYTQIPYTNYQPILPKLFFRAAVLLLIAVIGAAGYFKYKVAENQKAITSMQASIQTALQTHASQNNLYSDMFTRLNDKMVDGVQLDYLKAEAPSQQMLIRGKAYDNKVIQQFLSQLTAPTANHPFHITQVSQNVTQPKSPADMFTFEFTGKLATTAKQVTP